MTANAYRKIRERIGTQKTVSKVLGVTKNTLSDRERGVYRITREAELAIRYAHHAHTGGSLRWKA